MSIARRQGFEVVKTTHRQDFTYLGIGLVFRKANYRSINTIHQRNSILLSPRTSKKPLKKGLICSARRQGFEVVKTTHRQYFDNFYTYNTLLSALLICDKFWSSKGFKPSALQTNLKALEKGCS